MQETKYLSHAWAQLTKDKDWITTILMLSVCSFPSWGGSGLSDMRRSGPSSSLKGSKGLQNEKTLTSSGVSGADAIPLRQLLAGALYSGRFFTSS